jgi:hypothetical protein
MGKYCDVRRRHGVLLIGISLLTAATASGLPLPTKVQCVLVENAQISRQPLAKEGRFGRANYGHQITAGGRSVLAIRVYEDDGKGPDAQLFKKATLELKFPPVIAVGEDVTLNVIRSHYSEGASAWVEQGGYVWATNPFSHVQFRRDSNGLRAALRKNFDAANPSNSSRRQSEAIQVDLECPVQKQAVSELSSWIGWVGTNRASFYLIEDIVQIEQVHK